MSTTITETLPPTKRCACPWYDATTPTDARTCWDLRYYGHSPVNRGPNASYDLNWEEENDDDDECECSCHDADADDWDERLEQAAIRGY